MCGSADDLVPKEQSSRYADAALRAGDAVELGIVEGAGHYELVDPASAAWPVVRRAVLDLVAGAHD